MLNFSTSSKAGRKQNWPSRRKGIIIIIGFLFSWVFKKNFREKKRKKLHLKCCLFCPWYDGILINIQQTVGSYMGNSSICCLAFEPKTLTYKRKGLSDLKLVVFNERCGLKPPEVLSENTLPWTYLMGLIHMCIFKKLHKGFWSTDELRATVFKDFCNFQKHLFRILNNTPWRSQPLCIIDTKVCIPSCNRSKESIMIKVIQS